MPPKRIPGHLNMTATVSYTTAEQDVEEIDIVRQGWAVVEAKYFELKALMSAPTTGLNASQAREEQKQAVSSAISRLLDRAQAECRRLLVAGNAKAAVEGGLKTLKLKEEYYGAGSLQLVPAYFHLARTNQFMDRFKRAEEFLSLAQYEVLRHPEADMALNAELHQTFGLLYASDGKLDAALKQLTCSTYYLSCMYGPEHVMTSFGYFDIGNVFAAKSHMEHAMAMYDRVKTIWDTFLTANLANEAAGEPHESPSSFGEENVQDAVKMLRGIVGVQTDRYGQIHPNPAHGEQVLGLFLLWSGDAGGGFETLLRSLEIYKRVMGERHPKCQELRVFLVNRGFQVPEDTTGVLPEAEGTSPTPAVSGAPPSSASAGIDAPATDSPPSGAADAVEEASAPPAESGAGPSAAEEEAGPDDKPQQQPEADASESGAAVDGEAEAEEPEDGRQDGTGKGQPANLAAAESKPADNEAGAPTPDAAPTEV